MHLPPELRAETFTPHVGSPFALQGPQGPVALELTKVALLGHGVAGGREPFSLHFLAPDAAHLEQRTWTLLHPALGRLDIFLVPLGPVQGRMRYEAIFT
jgi:hypothetical protein